MHEEIQLSSSCPEVSTTKTSSMDRGVIEETETFSMDQGAIEIAIKGS